jgi:hypothetical protein
MDEALAIRTHKEPALQDCRNEYALGLPRDQKFQVYVAIRTLWRLADVLARIEQHGAASDLVRILSECFWLFSTLGRARSPIPSVELLDLLDNDRCLQS